MADWRVALLRSLGYKPTKQNLRFLETWQRWEGGHTKNDASFNWLNTTRGNGRSINTVGVKAFGSFGEGIQNTAATLRNGRYQDILDALASGDPYASPPGAGLQVWVSGSPVGNPEYARKVLGGKAVAPRRRALEIPGVPRVPVQHSDGSWDYAMGLIFEDDPEMVSIMRGLGDVGPSPLPQAKPSALRPRREGKALVLPTSWKGTHTTDGMDWGKGTAVDIMAPPGTPVGAPEDGVVVYYHPTGAQGGGSMLLRAASGRSYWIGHIDGAAVPPGTQVRRGQVITYVSADHSAPHVHLDRRG